MNLKSIVFVLENCDTIEVPGKYVGEMWADNIRKSFGRVGSNAFDQQEVCSSFVVEIHKDAERVRYPFEDLNLCKAHSVFERLSVGDITSIRVEFVDGEIPVDVMVPWCPEDDFTNRWQTSRISKCGHLYITISEQSIFDEVFPADMIDDEDIVSAQMALYDAGDAFRRG